MIGTFTSIIIYFLIVIIFDLAKILSFFGSLVIFLDIGNVNVSNRGSAILTS